MTKRELRQRIMRLRDEASLELRTEWDKRVFDALTSSQEYKAASCIFIFISYVSEVDTTAVIRHALDSGKRICVPKVKSKAEGLELYEIKSLDDVSEGYKGILEPRDGCLRVEPEELELIVMPGVAFDLDGGRIGYGGGFYDRFLFGLAKPVPRIAIAYELQLLDHIPMDEHDARIHGIITEARSVRFQ